MTGYIFRMTRNMFKITGYIFRMTRYIFRMTGDIFKMTGYIFRMTGYIFRMTGYMAPPTISNDLCRKVVNTNAAPQAIGPYNQVKNIY